MAGAAQAQHAPALRPTPPRLCTAVLDVPRRVHQLQHHRPLARPVRQRGAVDGGEGAHRAADAGAAAVPLGAEEGGAEDAQQAQPGQARARRRQPRQQVRQQRAVVLVVEVVVQHKGDVLRQAEQRA